MRAKGQGWLTLVLIGVVVVGALAVDRLGTKTPAAAAPGQARSGAWFCPHGGGEDWKTSLYLANPGETDVEARLTGLDDEGSEAEETVTVPAGGEVRLDAPAAQRGSASYVEYFGGWIAAGWVSRGGNGEIGIGAEPCAPAAGRSWYSAGVSTGQGEQGFLVVMNPFGADAVFDVAIFAAGREPVRDSELTDFSLRPGRSVAIKLNAYAEGESALAVELQTSTGRVAAATTVVSKASGITSVLASPATSEAAYLPTPKGAGQSILSLAVPTERGSVAGALLVTRDELPRPVGELTGGSLEPVSAAIFPVVSPTDASIDVSVQEGDPIIAALHTTGPGNDDAATAGAVVPDTAWVVTPTTAGDPAHPSLLLANPGDTDAHVTLRLLPLDGGEPQEVTVTVEAASLGRAPSDFLEAAPDASVLVTSDGAPIVALGSTTSLGTDGLSVFGSAVGVPIPAQDR